MGLMSEAQRAGRWSQEVTRDGDSDDSAMQWALSSLSHGGLYRHRRPSLGELRQAVGTVTASTRAVPSIARRFLRRERDVIVKRERAEAS